VYETNKKKVDSCRLVTANHRIGITGQQLPCNARR